MPLFRRPDGKRVRDVPPIRAIMPYLMRSRNESAVYHDSAYDVGATRAWLKAYNRAHPDRATLFHLFAWACARALHERPELNRFVSGGRLYQRNEVAFSFAVKPEFRDAAALVTVKLVCPPGEAFDAFVPRMTAAIEEARQAPRAVDREVALVMRLPGPLVRLGVALVRLLDAWNLLPGFFMKNDPMYASLFLANLGSAGVSDAYHHLYEYGTVSIFGALSAPARVPVVEEGGIGALEVLRVRWTFDERIHDAFYAARSLRVAQRIVEDPARWVGAPARSGPAEDAAAL
ncbi:MAG TPA: 2-oxo acid dehydrogenase subunit E2 [Anaeromyxobacter sp.]|nr:2-oxo acid dehydrogenase subunit E2 [Anaeromyxobacter sp.]